MKKVITKRDSYYDSVFLMQVTADLEGREGIEQVHVTMATPQNVELLRGLGFSGGLGEAGPNDLLVAVEGSEGAIDTLMSELDDMLAAGGRGGSAASGAAPRPYSLDGALRNLKGANLAIVSVPGEYAAIEASAALDRDLHVMLFSDNVSLEDEVELKKKAVHRGLLLMGPDCGTAIIDGVPLCFANSVARGPIGIVAASGTGAQEVSVLVDRFGSGCSQVIGTGGRDLKAAVGGLTARLAVRALAEDPETKVIVVISKPPDEEVAAKLAEDLEACGKPSVVHFIGRDAPAGTGGGGAPVWADCLEDAALKAISLCGDPTCPAAERQESEQALPDDLVGFVDRMPEHRRFVRGYFTGGTLCDETLYILKGALPELRSNIHEDEGLRLADPHVSEGHCLLDLGDDAFTRGRPHPMIEPATRVERMSADSETADAAVVLFDVVLGYGSHEDPAGAVIAAVDDFRRSGDDGGPVMLATVVGTDRDFQGYRSQKKKLEEHGVFVLPSNAAMARTALAVVDRLAGER